MREKLKRAFTITELVIVIAVIAVLAAVLIPTFSNVVESSKKSHDTQYVKELNIALNNYTVENNGVAPNDYEELMLALADAGLTDGSNPFLLATKLKQENVILVWYPNNNYVTLVDTADEGLVVSYVSTLGLGNGVNVFNQTGQSGADGYILCSTGSKDGEYVARLYKDFYITCGGDISKFMSGGYTSTDVINSMGNTSWANSINSSISNHKVGYTYSSSIEETLNDAFKTSSSVNISCIPSSQTSITKDTQFSTIDVETQNIITQSVRSTLATIATIANNDTKKDQLSSKKITLDVPKDTVVDMKDTTIAAIGNSYRKSSDVSTGSASTTVSLDFSGVTFTNLSIAKNTFISSGAEYQPESDNQYPGGGYAFTYGLLGTIVAKPGETVTISNLNIKGVNMDLTGATETVGGVKNVNTVSDMAGIVAGYTQGNVVFENIVIDGKATETSSQGYFSGYDGVAGIVGRSYGAKKDGKNVDSTLTFNNCKLSNMDIYGERRASGFVAYVGNNIAMNIKDSSIHNVNIYCQREDGKGINYVHGGTVFAHIGSNVTTSVENAIVENVTTTIYAKVNGEYQYIDYNNTLYVGPGNENIGNGKNNLVFFRDTSKKSITINGLSVDGFNYALTDNVLTKITN